MLTIQPNITHYSKTRALAFKGEDSSPNKEDAFYQGKLDAYETQIKDLNESLNNDKTPGVLKKIIKPCKIASEALLEGWAVAWGASKGSRVVKSSVVKTVEKEGVKVAEVLTPFGEKIQKYGSKVFGAIGKGLEKLKNTKLAQKTGEKFSKLVEKMRENKIGKYIVKAFEAIGNFVTNKIINPLKGVKASEMYDKTSKVASNTLGVGAGAAGAYNAAVKPDANQKVAETNEVDDLDLEDDDIEEIGE